jgi:hypothetical protein
MLAVTEGVRSQTSSFDASERSALTRGDLVRREVTRREGSARLFGGTSFQRIRAPIDAVWAKASDPAALTELIPSLDRARVVEERGGVRVVRMDHAGLVPTSYHLRMELDERVHAMTFRLDESRRNDVRSGRGFMSLAPYRGGTMVTWGMLIDPGVGVMSDVFGPMLSGWLLRPPSCLRDAVEPGREPSC